jgi:hypothetical protein
MDRIDHFVPGIAGDAEGIADHLRQPIPQGVGQAYVKAFTEPGERVLIPYCQGAEVVREILSLGRIPIALNFDPLLVLLTKIELATPSHRELDAAVARLGDSFKQGVPLRHYLMDLYATVCPACLRPAVADYFVWDREGEAPIAKYVRCPSCDWDGRAAMEAEDRARIDQMPAGDMHHHFLLDRIAPASQGRALRVRIESLLGLYSPRSLYALVELTLKLESIFSQGALLDTLRILLLDCLDRCSSLTPLPGSAARRRGLARPGRFLEFNVWRAFELAADRLQAQSVAPAAGLAASLGTFSAESETQAGVVATGLVRDMPRALPPRSLRLILTSPPPLDSSVWSLSYLWGGWLLGAEAVTSLRPLLRQRTPDTDWYARVMARSLSTLVDLLQDNGRLVLILSEQRPGVVEALVFAASRARLGMAALVQCGSDYRIELTTALPQPTIAARGTLELEIRRAAAEAALHTIKMRGEPVPWLTLHAQIQGSLAQTGLLGRASDSGSSGPTVLDLVAEQFESALASEAFQRLPGHGSREELWWLTEPDELDPPLCDRVEAAAYEILQDTLALTEADFVAALYARFPGCLTPGAGLVTACLVAYGSEATPGWWQLRGEDQPLQRTAERSKIVKHLVALGKRMGYRAVKQQPFDVVWLDGQTVRSAFVVRWQAVVSDMAALGRACDGASMYLVIPGGRAALVSYKLAHNPLWQRTVDRDGWWFIKYRHIRQLIAQPEVDEYSFRTVVGLDPIVERETAQLPLF